MPSTSLPTSDPSLAALTPLPTRGRSLLLMAVATALLVGAWFSPDLLRPGLATHGGTSGGSVQFPADRTLLVFHEGSAIAPIGGEITSIGDVPGATVTGAWLFQPAAELPDQVWNNPTSESDEDLAEAYGPGVLDAAALPQPITSGRVQILVRWRITDCDALEERAEVPMTVTNILGMSFERALPDTASPGYQLDGWESESALCPPPGS